MINKLLPANSKTGVILGVLTAAIIISAWDYTGYFSQWNAIGLPVTMLLNWALYLFAYHVLVPVRRLHISRIKFGALFVAGVLLFSASSFLVAKLTISESEYSASAAHVGEVLGTGKKSVMHRDSTMNRDYIMGMMVVNPFTLLLYVIIANYHRRNHWLLRLDRWWKNEKYSLSWLHMVWLVLGWVLWLFLTIFSNIFSGKPIVWSTTLLMVLPSVIFFYINLKTSFSLLIKNKIVLALLSSLALWVILVVVKIIWFFLLTKGFGLPSILNGVDVFQTIPTDGKSSAYKLGRAFGRVASIANSWDLVILLISFIYGYARKSEQYQQDLRDLAESRQKEMLKQKVLEKEVLDARLQSLKYQINPHFLFNSLNFLYSQSLSLSDDLARATMLLSKMMRYGLQENNDEAKVSLVDEIEHLYNFIEFNQLRFSNYLQIDFSVQGQVQIRRIMPLLLITFVENAFKYGELHQEEFPLQIHLKVDSEKLVFFVKNKIRSGPKEDSTGIGIENIKRRLALGYPGKHILSIQNDSEFYASELTIIL
ncbi:sensor histidine kinase [Dyadobacter frigoris]|nr:histidine kinase [Dyadobacter frigoris]GLU55741.1 hypothetical protein Dfri01_52020 [Dyadobacter frigoris]